jgi:hypothetical protein
LFCSAQDDDFYSSLAADADADISEISVSEADPNQMAKSLAVSTSCLWFFSCFL